MKKKLVTKLQKIASVELSQRKVFTRTIAGRCGGCENQSCTTWCEPGFSASGAPKCICVIF
jgi:hypothetical protein